MDFIHLPKFSTFGLTVSFYFIKVYFYIYWFPWFLHFSFDLSFSSFSLISDLPSFLVLALNVLFSYTYWSSYISQFLMHCGFIYLQMLILLLSPPPLTYRLFKNSFSFQHLWLSRYHSVSISNSIVTREYTSDDLIIWNTRLVYGLE